MKEMKISRINDGRMMDTSWLVRKVRELRRRSRMNDGRARDRD